MGSLGRTFSACAFAFSIIPWITGAKAAPIEATAELFNVLNQGIVTNTSDSAVVITGISFTLGEAAAGIGTWDSNGGSRLAGGTPSDFLSDPNYFQTINFTGLSVAPGISFEWADLDIDGILSVSPLNVSGLTSPTALDRASITAFFGDGTSASADLFPGGGPVPDQNLVLATIRRPEPPAPPPTVAEPGTLALFCIGLAGLGLLPRRRSRS